MNRGWWPAFWVLCCLGCDQQRPSPPPAPPRALPSSSSTPDAEKKVVLKVQASTWRPDFPPFDIAQAVRNELRRSKVDVVDDSARDPDGIVLVRYEEKKGQAYSSTFGFGARAGWGTLIDLNLHVLSASGEMLGSLSAQGNTPSYAEGGLYEEALDALKRSEAFKIAGNFVASAIGLRDRYPKLLPALLKPSTQKEVAALLDRVRFEPADAEEDAMLAIGRGDPARCEKLGKAAVKPLVEALSYLEGDPARPLVAALTRIGDPEATRWLLERLRPLLDPKTAGAGNPLTVTEALGSVGDSSALAELDRISRMTENRAELAAAATKAAGRIRSRAR